MFSGTKSTINIKDRISYGKPILISEFVLYDLNRTVNEEIGREVHDFRKLIPNQEDNIVISYKNVGITSK